MRFEARPSWRLSVSDDGDLDLLLWFRDALGLVDAADDAPPRCEPGPPDRSALVVLTGQVGQSGDRWLVPAGGVGAVVVVLVDPCWQSSASFGL